MPSSFSLPGLGHLELRPEARVRVTGFESFALQRVALSHYPRAGLVYIGLHGIVKIETS